MRYAYVKNGDAVDQVRQLSSMRQLYRSGPNAYIGEFLESHTSDDVFVICRTGSAEQFVSQHVLARSYADDRTRRGRLISALRVGFAMFRWRPDRILCGCTTELLWISVVVAKLLHVPIVNSRHNGLLRRAGLASIASSLDRVCIRACDAVVCNGPYTADQIRELGVPELKIFEFIVDLTSFVEPQEESRVSKTVLKFVRDRDFIITFVGRLQRDKGIFDLLKAFCRLRTSVPRVGLLFVGNGKDAALLEQQARNSGAANDILFMGRTDHRLLSEIIRFSSLAVAPTKPEFPEGYPKVVLEALVLGVPVVAPRCGPFPYAIDHSKNGLLFEPGSHEDLWNCLSRIAQDTDMLERLRCGAQETSRRLLKDRSSFGDAVEAAFAGCD